MMYHLRAAESSSCLALSNLVGERVQIVSVLGIHCVHVMVMIAQARERGSRWAHQYQVLHRESWC